VEPRKTPRPIQAPENPLESFVAMIADAVAERLQRGQSPRLLTIREVAQYLHRSERWVRLEIASGRLECVREGRSRPRIDREVLDRWIAERNGREG
jgi:excisionase family DNA binding protein